MRSPDKIQNLKKGFLDLEQYGKNSLKKCLLVFRAIVFFIKRVYTLRLLRQKQENRTSEGCDALTEPNIFKNISWLFVL